MLLGNIDFAADDQGALLCFIHERLMCLLSVKQCLRSVNHKQFPMQMTQNRKHNKWLQILTEGGFPPKLLWRMLIKIHRLGDRRRQPQK